MPLSPHDALLPCTTHKASCGFVFIILGRCDQPPNLNLTTLSKAQQARETATCSLLRETHYSIASIRALNLSWVKVALIVDQRLSWSWTRQHMGADVVVPLRSESIASHNFIDNWNKEDLRVAKLAAYPQSPFDRSVFLDSDTYVRTPFAAKYLFGALSVFDLLSAFECCRNEWEKAKKPYDEQDVLHGWEMQTGVVAYNTNAPSVKQFWAAALQIYKDDSNYWRKRSSGEQGAATLALSQVAVRYMPLPPSFNGRRQTMNLWLKTFGMPIYHGHHLWMKRDASNKPMPPVEQRIADEAASTWSGAMKDALEGKLKGAIRSKEEQQQEAVSAKNANHHGGSTARRAGAGLASVPDLLAAATTRPRSSSSAPQVVHAKPNSLSRNQLVLLGMLVVLAVAIVACWVNSNRG